MLLKKNEKGDIVKGIYESSNILTSEYNKKSKDLTIVFSYGGTYTYENVPLTDFTRFEIADSQGKVLNSHIKKYSFINNGKIDTKTIKEDIKKIKEDDIKDYLGVVVVFMKGITSEFDTNGDVPKATMDKLKDLISSYESKLK